jgi:pimeloyl-ACP methyl ester carboxylesterase
VEHITSGDGTRIAYGRSGSGRPLVLVHGTSVERSSFRFVEPLLTDRFTLYSVDRRGRGESGDSTDGYAIEQEFADIAAVVDSLAEPADLLGHSYGATVALGAARLTRNVRRLILYEPAPGVPQVDPELLARLDALLAEGERERLLSVFLTELGLDPDALEQLRPRRPGGCAWPPRTRSRVSCGPRRATDRTSPPSRRSPSLRCFCSAARAPSGRRTAPRSSSPSSRTLG